MDSERQQIYEVLNSIVRKRGGKKDLEDLYPALRNPYIDDGSLEFEKTYTDVVYKIAEYLFDLKGMTNAEKLQAIKAVPEATINKVLKNLRESWDIDNEDKLIKYEAAEKAESKIKAIRDREQKKKDLDALVGSKTPSEIRKMLREYDEPMVDDIRNKIVAAPVPRIERYIPAELSNEAKKIMGKGRKKIRLSEAERKRRSDRMKKLHKQNKI